MEKQIDLRPSAKQVDWLTHYTRDGQSVHYTFKEYRGSVPYVYRWEHLPTGKFGYSQIFGVSIKTGDALVEAWAAMMPAVWKYTIVNQLW